MGRGMSRPVSYTFASGPEVRQLASGRWQYTDTGKFAPEKAGRPLAAGYKKDSRGRVYNQSERAARGRRNFGLPPAAAPPPPKRSRAPLKAAGLSLLVPPNVYTSQSLADISPEAKEAAAAIASRDLSPGAGPVYGYYRVTVARWAEDWTSFVIAYDPRSPTATATITASTGITDQPAAAGLNAEELALRKKYIALDSKLDADDDAIIETIAIIVPIRAIRGQ